MKVNGIMFLATLLTLPKALTVALEDHRLLIFGQLEEVFL